MATWKEQAVVLSRFLYSIYGSHACTSFLSIDSHLLNITHSTSIKKSFLKIPPLIKKPSGVDSR